MDPDFAECTFKLSFEDDGEMMEQIKEHLMTVHSFEEDELGPDMEDKIFSAIKESEDEEDMLEDGEERF